MAWSAATKFSHNPSTESQYFNRFDSSSTTGLFTRVSTKPTNHSKFTGKCGRPACRGCHVSLVYKSKKGTQKLHLVTRRVADAKPGTKLSGFLVIELLDQMDGESNDFVDEVYEMSSENGSLAVDIKDHDEDECENKGF